LDILFKTVRLQFFRILCCKHHLELLHHELMLISEMQKGDLGLKI